MLTKPGVHSWEEWTLANYSCVDAALTMILVWMDSLSILLTLRTDCGGASGSARSGAFFLNQAVVFLERNVPLVGIKFLIRSLKP